MSGKDHAIFRETGVIENFRGVAMREQVVGFEIFIDFNEMEVAAKFFTCARGTGFAITDHLAAFGDPVGFRERAERQDHAGGVATGIGDESRFGDFVGVKLGQAVNGFAEPIWREAQAACTRI